MKGTFEDRTTRITANDQVLRDDLHRVRKTTTPAGKALKDQASKYSRKLK